MPAQTKYRFNTQQYYRMAETGVLGPEERVELLDGELLDMSPIGPFHGGVVNHLGRLFNQLCRGRWLMAVQNPLHLDDHSEPQPDLMLLHPVPDDYKARHPQPEDVFLLIEVADATLESDREKKLPAYARAGIKESWLVNLEEETIEFYREPHRTGYKSVNVLRAGSQAIPLVFPDAAVDVAALLNRGV
jgi:Uma2 family endonuclease